MKKTDAPAPTAAIQWLQRHHVPYRLLTYSYQHGGGARHAASMLALELHHVAKTLVMENEQGTPFIVIMHGDCDVSLKNLARQTGDRKIVPCTPAAAQRHTGYLVGGTSPFGTRKAMPVRVQKTLLTLPEIHINAGKRGLLLSLSPQVLTQHLGAQPIDAIQQTS